MGSQLSKILEQIYKNSELKQEKNVEQDIESGLDVFIDIDLTDTSPDVVAQYILPLSSSLYEIVRNPFGNRPYTSQI